MQKQVYSIDEIRKIVTPIAKQHGVDKVFLFGSYARGDATPASDVDLVRACFLSYDPGALIATRNNLSPENNPLRTQ